MSRPLATIQKIIKLDPIPGADAIEKATVLGWEVVVKKGDFNPGDPCVYVEVDSILPDRPEFEFMRTRKFRVKTIKLKGQVSQGICFPLSILDPIQGHSTIKDTDATKLFRLINRYNDIGDDVTDDLNIVKHDPQAEQETKILAQQKSIFNSRFAKFLRHSDWLKRTFLQRLPFPSFIPKTDEARIQAIPAVFDKIVTQDLRVDITEKLDGQSATYFLIPRRFLFFWRRLEFGVCSRNFLIPKNVRTLKTTYWKIAAKYAIEKRLRLLYDLFHETFAIQGEIVGPGVGDNPYKFKELRFYVFNVFSINNPTRYDSSVLLARITDMNYSGIPGEKLQSVPVLEFYSKLTCTNIPELVDYSKGKSTIADCLREGLVIRNYEHQLSFKVINPDYLLKYNQ